MSKGYQSTESTASVVKGALLSSIERFVLSKSLLSVRYWGSLDEALSYGKNQFTEVRCKNDHFIGIMTSRFAPSSW